MAKKIVLAGILGGIVMFLWGGLWHDQLPFGVVGLRSLPSEAAMLSTMKANIPDQGMYIFPGFGVPDDATFAEKKAGMRKLEQNPPAGPQGFLIYRPTSTGLSGKMLITEALTNILQALLVAFLLAQAGLRRFSSRLGFVFVLGLFASIASNISYWNWYGFPGTFILAYIVSLLVGYFLVGLVVAAIVKSSAPKAATAGA